MFRVLKELASMPLDIIREFPKGADENVQMGLTARVIIKGFERMFEGENLVNAIQQALSNEKFQTPFALNEFGDCLNRHQFPELALPLFTRAAIEYPRETPDDKTGADVVQHNLLKTARGTNQKAIQLRAARQWNKAVPLFELVVEQAHAFLSQTGIEDHEIQHEKDAAFNWLNSPTPGFRSKPGKKRLH